ncbi:MAG: hypothetical protein HY403_11395 [Elusimicrobia bacterium]|nr:hypothetical protein [Elusimicrobiota bacterium]
MIGRFVLAVLLTLAAGRARSEVSEDAERGRRGVAGTIGGVAGRLASGDVPGIYSERAPAQAAGGVYAGGGSALAPAPEISVPIPQAAPSEVPVPFAEDADGRRRHVDAILGLVRGNGASAEAVANAKAVLEGMLGRAAPDVLQRLAGNLATVDIIPKDGKLTDLPAFRYLKGRYTMDARAWDQLRGMGWTTHDVKGSCAFGEENMVGGGGRQFPRYHLLLHEFGHTVHRGGLAYASSEDKVLDRLGVRGIKAPTVEDVKAVYVESMKRGSKTALGAYADSNEGEMFAQGTAAFFDRGLFGEDAEFLRKKNERLYELLRAIYGAPKSLKP